MEQQSLAPGNQEPYFTTDSQISLNIFLAACPQSHPPTAPHCALPYLKGYLGQTLPNTHTTIKDLDAIYYAYAFSPEQLSSRFSPEEAERMREAYAAQQNISAYRDVARFIQHHKTLETALDRIAFSHRQERNLQKESIRLRGNTFTYVSERPSYQRASVLESVGEQHREDNLFYQFYQDVVIPHIQRGKYDLVAFSVFLPDQILPTALLSAMIKQENPGIKVVWGGNYLTRFNNILSQDDALNRQLFTYVDAIITHEGEVPLKEVLQRIQKNAGFQGINQVISLDGNGRVVYTFDGQNLPSLDMDMLPRPDFDGIFTDLEGRANVFWTPSPVISLYTQRGCPFAGGCDFCTIMSANNRPNSKLARSPRKVAEDITFYQKRYGSTVFSFGNETLSREFMLFLSEELRTRGLEAAIEGYTRTDQLTAQGQIDRGALAKIGKYFKFLQIGVESHDEETLKSMRKGRKSATDSDLFAAMFSSGIYPHAFLLTGFPPPKKDYQGRGRDDFINYYIHSSTSSLNWLRDNARHIGTYKATRLVIPRDDRKMIRVNGEVKAAEAYDHELHLTPDAGDLEFNLPYEKINGSTELDARTTALFDMVPTPFRTYTHNTVYHQRMFNWDEGIRWSLSHPEGADEISRANRAALGRTLRRLWNEAVGADYVAAVRELAKKGGINEDKRGRLQLLISERRAKNIITGSFPTGIVSFDELLHLHAHPK
ncbi:MAG TPA: radical SAM protein [Candidatus Nanoarchaeia archaeon]|nr:radical SAM protein [Candidatus Nanoarchaeia archaeon]